MTPPAAVRVTDIPWWRRPKPTPPMNYPLIPVREQAESEHPHWGLRVPGRAVLRRQAYRAGAYRPRRLSRGKGKGRNRGFFHGPAVPNRGAIGSLLANLPTLGRWGGDR